MKIVKSFRFLLTCLACALLTASCGGNSPFSTQSDSSQQATSSVLSSGGEASSKDAGVSSEEGETSKTEISSKEIASSEEASSNKEELTSEEIESLTSEYVSSKEQTTTTSKEGGDVYHRPDDDARWPLSFLEYGQKFRNRLAKLIRASGSRTIGYKANNNILAESDKAQNGRSGVVPFYHADTESTTSWNKEHVWPNSRGAGEDGPGSDPQMLRPTKSSDNNDRGNHFYGDDSLDTAGNTWDPACLGYEAARGECARIIFYCATRYYDSCGSTGSSSGTAPLSLSNNPNDAPAKHTMGRLDRLIEWNNKYPVTAQEIRRNNYLDNAGFARNPFIDHPEYANWIWDSDGLRDAAPASDYQGEEQSLPEISYKHEYYPIYDESALENPVGIAGRVGASSPYYGMTDSAKSDTLPWYIVGEELVYENNSLKTDSDNVALFTFNKLSNGKYTITVGNKSLYHYIDGSHYSIGYNVTDKSGAGNEWTVTVSSGGKATIVGATNQVYLEYYNGSFCGYQYEPRESLLLFC